MGHEHHRRVEAGEVALEPLQRGDVEVVGGLVEQQQGGVAGQRPRQRGARELAAGEAVERPVELLVAEAEPVQRADGADAPIPAAGVLEPGLGAWRRRRITSSPCAIRSSSARSSSSSATRSPQPAST